MGTKINFKYLDRKYESTHLLVEENSSFNVTSENANCFWHFDRFGMFLIGRIDVIELWKRFRRFCTQHYFKTVYSVDKKKI